MRRTLVIAVLVAASVGLTACSGSSRKAVAAAPVGDMVTAIPALSGDSTTLELDPDTLKALTSLGLSLSSSGSALYDPASSRISFPITGGYAEVHSDPSVQPGYVQGSLVHEGSGRLPASRSVTAGALPR